MRRVLKSCLMLSLVLPVSILAAGGDVAYQAKTFSGKTLDNKSYKAKSYRSEKSSRDKQFEESNKKTGGFWSFFGRGKKKEYEALPEQKQQQSKDYQKDKRINLKVEHPEDKALKGEKNLDSDEMKSKDYKPSDIKRGYNPLLAPRQGIKAPVIKIKNQ